MRREHKQQDHTPDEERSATAGSPERADVVSSGDVTNDAGAKEIRGSGRFPIHLVNRRQFIAASAATGAGAMALPVVMAQEGTPEDQVVDPLTDADEMEHHEPSMPEGDLASFTFFTPFQAAIVAAAAQRLIPTDDNGPGAAEAGVVYFIDRQLRQEQNFTSYRGPRYGLGPFIPGEPTQGDQSALDMQNRWRLGIEGMNAYAENLYDTDFADLEPDQQVRILQDLEQGIPEDFPPLGEIPGGGDEYSAAATAAIGGAEGWFQLLHSFTLAGFFSDPVHGGNRDMVGWKLIGFPGAQGFVYDEWILRYGEEFTGDYQSLAAYQDQFTGEN